MGKPLLDQKTGCDQLQEQQQLCASVFKRNQFVVATPPLSRISADFEILPELLHVASLPPAVHHALSASGECLLERLSCPMEPLIAVRLVSTGRRSWLFRGSSN